MHDLTLALLIFLFPLAYSPGPGNLFFALIGAGYGLRATLPALAGYHLATFAATLAVGMGFLGLMQLSPVLGDLLRYAGAAYVLWLALRVARSGGALQPEGAGQASALDGAILLLLNPKAWLILALMFTQFLPAAGSTDPRLVLWITTVFTLNNLIAFTLWAVAGDRLLHRLRNPSQMHALNTGFALMLAGVALWMLLR